MQTLQASIKAVAAVLSSFVASLIAFYNLNQNVTLKSFVSSVIVALFAGGIVHQVPKNKEQ